MLLPPEIRREIMRSFLRDLPQWMHKALNCGIARDVVQEKFNFHISQLDISIWGIAFFAMPWVRKLVEMFGIEVFLRNGRISRPDAEFVMRQSRRLATKAELEKTKRALRIAERECSELKSSLAYRVGMVVTWPVRKMWGGVRCLRENGVKYTFMHATGKVLRK